MQVLHQNYSGCRNLHEVYDEKIYLGEKEITDHDLNVLGLQKNNVRSETAGKQCKTKNYQVQLSYKRIAGDKWIGRIF